MKTKQPKKQNETVQEKTLTETPDTPPAGNVGSVTSAEPPNEPEHPEEKKVKAIEEKKPEPKNLEDSINSALGSYNTVPDETKLSKVKKTRKRRTSVPEEPQKLSFEIPGSLFTNVCDSVLTGGIGVIDSLVAPDNPVDVNKIKLTEKQIEQLSPVAEAAVREMKLSDKPIEVFFGSLAAIYMSNYFALRNHMKYESNHKKV